MRLKVLASGLAGALLFVPALAQTPPMQTPVPLVPSSAAPTATTPMPMDISGTVVSAEAQILTLSIVSENGVSARSHGVAVTMALTLSPSTLYVVEVPRKVSDIHVGDYVGTLAVKRADGTFHSQEAHAYDADTPRPPDEGFRTLAGADPNRTLTTGTVIAVTPLPGGGLMMKLRYHGAGEPGDPNCSGKPALADSGCVAEADFIVSPGVHVVAFQAGDRTSLDPGAAVFVHAAPSGDGYEARAITVERKAVKSPL